MTDSNERFQGMKYIHTMNYGSKEDILLTQVKLHLITLSDEERIKFIKECMADYCELCGSQYLPCYCASNFDK